MGFCVFAQWFFCAFPQCFICARAFVRVKARLCLHVFTVSRVLAYFRFRFEALIA